MSQFDDKIKIGIDMSLGKKSITLPKNWNKITESIYNNEANYAILTGKLNNIIVIDLDNKDPEFIGFKWFIENFDKIENINTLVTKTLNNGYHIYFKYNHNVKNKLNMNNLNIDILTDNKCCYQGVNYPIVNNSIIRELTENELKLITTTITQIKKELVVENKDKQIIPYKKGNKFFKLPDSTSWEIEKLDNGIKFTPDCNKCLVNECKVHSTTKHSSLFINKDKSVIKNCFSCGSDTLNKSDSKLIINVFLNIQDQETTIYKQLIKELLNISFKNNYKREIDTGIVYKQVKPYAYIKYKDPKNYLNEIFIDDQDFISNVNNMDNLIKFMKQYNHTEFGFIEYNKDYIGFNNGVLNVITCEFIENVLDNDIIVNKYFDTDFNYSMDTPLFDKILQYQFDESVCHFIYMCIGRLFGIRDNYGFMLYLLGEPGCGKSIFIDIICECFNNIGSIGNSFEEKFGLSFLYDKEIIVCDDLPKNISKIFPQQTFQTCITGGKIPIAVKGGDGFTINWTTPMLWAGNWFPDYFDKGQISRRMLVANFEKIVKNPEPTLKQRIINTELPALIYKSLMYYKETLVSNDNKDIWKICPEYFLDQQTDMKMERNPLYKYLTENTCYEKDHMLSIEEIKNAFSTWLGKKVSKLDNGTFLQVNQEYTIDQLIICKNCKKDHKKGCCENYNRLDRSSKKIIININFI